MKNRSILSFILLTLFVTSCKKDKNTTPTVVGNWTVEAVGTQSANFYGFWVYLRAYNQPDATIKEITWSPWNYQRWKWSIADDLSYTMDYAVPAGMHIDLSGKFTYERNILQSGDGWTWEIEVAPDNKSMVATALGYTGGHEVRTPYRLRRID
jgi:hypothetical protein